MENNRDIINLAEQLSHDAKAIFYTVLICILSLKFEQFNRLFRSRLIPHFEYWAKLIRTNVFSVILSVVEQFT